HRDLIAFRERDQLLAALERPLAPGGNDADRRLEGMVGQLEADLVVAFASRAVTHRVGTGLARNFDLLFGDQGTRDRGAEQVGSLVEGVGAKHRKNVVADELLAQILDEYVALLDPEHERLTPRRLELFPLA